MLNRRVLSRDRKKVQKWQAWGHPNKRQFDRAVRQTDHAFFRMASQSNLYCGFWLMQRLDTPNWKAALGYRVCLHQVSSVIYGCPVAVQSTTNHCSLCSRIQLHRQHLVCNALFCGCSSTTSRFSTRLAKKCTSPTSYRAVTCVMNRHWGWKREITEDIVISIYTIITDVPVSNGTV